VSLTDGPCDWEIDTSCAPGWDELSASQQEVGYTLATMTLWAATGRRFGLCTITVQPCKQKRRWPLYEVFPVPAWGYGTGYGAPGIISPFICNGQWFNGGWGGCRCRARCELPLQGPTTTAGVLEITVKGEVVDPSAYVIMNGYLLVRTDGDCWPSCVDYSQQDPPEFTVTYQRGNPLPPSLAIAAGILANEYGKACGGDQSCRLPSRLTSLSRQGVDVQVAQISEYLDLGLTEIPEVDRIIVALNPYRQQERSAIYSVDTPIPRQVV